MQNLIKKCPQTCCLTAESLAMKSMHASQDTFFNTNMSYIRQGNMYIAIMLILDMNSYTTKCCTLNKKVGV